MSNKNDMKFIMEWWRKTINEYDTGIGDFYPGPDGESTYSMARSSEWYRDWEKFMIDIADPTGVAAYNDLAESWNDYINAAADEKTAAWKNFINGFSVVLNAIDSVPFINLVAKPAKAIIKGRKAVSEMSKLAKSHGPVPSELTSKANKVVKKLYAASSPETIRKLRSAKQIFKRNISQAIKRSKTPIPHPELVIQLLAPIAASVFQYFIEIGNINEAIEKAWKDPEHKDEVNKLKDYLKQVKSSLKELYQDLKKEVEQKRNEKVGDEEIKKHLKNIVLNNPSINKKLGNSIVNKIFPTYSELFRSVLKKPYILPDEAYFVKELCPTEEYMKQTLFASVEAVPDLSVDLEYDESTGQWLGKKSGDKEASDATKRFAAKSRERSGK